MYIDDYIQVMQPLVINNDVEVTYYSKKEKKKPTTSLKLHINSIFNRIS